jgi:hypothetical protein
MSVAPRSTAGVHPAQGCGSAIALAPASVIMKRSVLVVGPPAAGSCTCSGSCDEPTFISSWSGRAPQRFRRYVEGDERPVSLRHS